MLVITQKKDLASNGSKRYLFNLYWLGIIVSIAIWKVALVKNEEVF